MIYRIKEAVEDLFVFRFDKSSICSRILRHKDFCSSMMEF